MKKVVEIYIKILTNKNYSKKTIETYVCYLEKFLNDVNKNPYHITTNEIRDYLLNKTYSSISVQNQIIGSLKLFAKYILNKKDIHLNKLERPRKEKRLPQVIDKDFILERISKIENLKHKAIISLAFSVGLRVSEVINLKIADVDSKRMLINIRQAKGKKDRIVPLSITILDLLRLYFKKYKPNEYLFNGQFSNQYSSTSCNQLVKKYLGHDYHFHTLRHSSFTTMLESGIDLSIIQKIAGHNNPKTTQIYTHISNQMLNRIQLPI
jgi:site-specific recombinase XerD